MEDYLRIPDTDPMLAWWLLQRGPWVHGTVSLHGCLAEAVKYEVSPVASRITCLYEHT